MQILNLEKLEMLKVTIMKGIRSLKFLKEEYLGPMKQTLFKAYFQYPLIMLYPAELHYKFTKDW